MVTLSSRPKAALNPYFKLGVSVGNISTATLPEPSGIFYGLRSENENYLWAIADSGASASFIAINRNTAAVSGVWAVTGATNVDWEAMTGYSMGSNNFIVACDVGNNANTVNSRGTGIDVILYRCKEPAITGSNGTIGAPDVEIIQCVYPAGNTPALRDCEAAIADPDTGKIYLPLKRTSPVPVYSLPYAASYSGIQTLTYEGTMTADSTFNTISTTVTGNNGYATDACISSNGQEIIVHSYDSLYYWKRNKGSETIFAALNRVYDAKLTEAYVGGGGGADNTASTNPKYFHPEGEPQGEDVTFDKAGVNFYTTSEWASTQSDVSGARAVNPLFLYERLNRAPTILSLQTGTNGYAGVTDTFIDQATPAQQNDAATANVLDIDFSTYPTITRYRQTLLRFDLSSIPPNSTILSAYLTLYISNEGKQIALYRMLQTWNSATITWTSSGGILMDNVEASSTPGAIYGTNQTGAVALDAYVGFCRINVPSATIQAWVSNSAVNFGWMGTGGPTETTGDGLQIDSAEGATASRRPKLTIVYFP